LFFSDELVDQIVEQGNLYACQVDPNRPLNLARSGLEVFLGICRFLVYRDIDFIGVLPPEFHRRPTPCPESDKLFKLRPFLDNLQQKFANQVKLEKLCVDEQIVPFKGRSSLKQYNPKKSNKWRYKIFIACDKDGLIHNFEVYTGKILPVSGKDDIGASGNIVLRLAAVIPKHKYHFLFFDNWLTSLKLLTTLYKDGIYSLGAVRKDIIHGLTFSSDNIMKKKGRGTYEEDEATIEDVKIFALKWFDNKSVCLASTFYRSHPIDTVERFVRKEKTKINIQRPNMVKEYNLFMGGVDLLDGLISYYRITLRSRKWYLNIFFHFIDLVIVTAWIRYKADKQIAGLEKKDILDSLGFRAEVAFWGRVKIHENEEDQVEVLKEILKKKGKGANKAHTEV
ncbi:unnamed protein product, partial [Acanthoscelides obtectus]